jgi:hypothetical protein
MFGSGRRRIEWSPPWLALSIVAAVILFVGLLAVNIAGQGYVRQTFSSSNFDPKFSSSFPANFLRTSLNDKPRCEPVLIRQGDGMFTPPLPSLVESLFWQGFSFDN